LQNCSEQTPPVGAQKQQLALQQNSPLPHTALPQVSPAGSSPVGAAVDGAPSDGESDPDGAGHESTTVPPCSRHRHGLQASVHVPSGIWHGVPSPQMNGQTVPGSEPSTSSVRCDGSDGEAAAPLQPAAAANTTDSVNNAVRIAILPVMS
jgi:hypothetical protein